MRLIPLDDIPAAGRAAERAARRTYHSRAAAALAAQWRIVLAPGCHGAHPDDPPVVGWVCTRQAAEALEAQATRMPGGTSHRRLRAVQWDDSAR